METANPTSSRFSGLLRASRLFESCWSCRSAEDSDLAVGGDFFFALEAAVVLEDFCTAGVCVFARGVIVGFFCCLDLLYLDCPHFID